MDNVLWENVLILLNINGYDRKSINEIYLRGSRALDLSGIRFDGTPSDWDFVVVGNFSDSFDHFTMLNCDFAIYHNSTFKNIVRAHKIWAFECLLAPKKNILLNSDRNYRIDLYKIDLNLLKESVLFEIEYKIHKASLLATKKDLYGALKSYFIAIRFLFYATEIARFRTIRNFYGVNFIWIEIMKRKNTFCNFSDVLEFCLPFFHEYLYQFLCTVPQLVFNNLWSEFDFITLTLENHFNTDPFSSLNFSVVKMCVKVKKMLLFK